MSPVPPLTADCCLFLDLDGTLLDLRDDPATIRADPALLALLRSIAARRLGGALAIISGRPIADLDACFEPLRFAAAGIHGVERRGADGAATMLPVDAGKLRATVRQAAGGHGGHADVTAGRQGRKPGIALAPRAAGCGRRCAAWRRIRCSGWARHSACWKATA